MWTSEEDTMCRVWGSLWFQEYSGGRVLEAHSLRWGRLLVMMISLEHWRWSARAFVGVYH